MEATVANLPVRPNPRLQGLNESRGNVLTTLSFAVRQDSKPSIDSSALTGGEPVLHFETEEHIAAIRDIRHLADAPTLDAEGFELRSHLSKVQDFYDDAAIRQVYERELDGLLKSATGASEVTIFDHTRRSDSASGAANPDGARGPAGRIHVDYTESSGPERAATVLGKEKFDRILQSGGHIAQVNVWRPIVGPVRSSPLALGDARSIHAVDLIATDQTFPDRVGEIYHLAWAPGQHWYWAAEMRPDEALLIKGWDSRNDGRARFTPHSAFRLPDQARGARPRESIESRCFLVFET